MGSSGALQVRDGNTRYDIQLLGGSTLWVDAWVEYFQSGKGFLGSDDNGKETYDAGTTGIRNVGYFMTIPGAGTSLGTGVPPQKPVPQTPLTQDQRVMVRSEMEKLLKGRKDCRDFLASVLFTVAVNTQTPLYSSDFLSDPLKIFDAIVSQTGFFLAPGQGASGYAWGGKVTFDSISPTFSTGLVGWHESAHEAGTRVFTDQELGWAAYQVSSAQGYADVKPGLYPPPRTNNVRDNSAYWNDRLFKACSPNQHK